MASKMDVARLGIEAEAFLATPVGQYLQQRVREEVAEALMELKTITPNDTSRIIELQNNIWRAESFNAWFGELITSGWEAEKEIRSMEGRE